MDLAVLAAMNEERTARRAAILVTDIASGVQRLVREADFPSDPLGALLSDRLRAGKSGMADTPEGQVFLTVQAPPVRILITGAVHISQALAPMAGLLGHDVIVVDPRTAFATPERFPDVELHALWPDEVLPRLGIDRYTAFVALTHDPKIDDPALAHALRSGCFYIGALGSRKTHAARVGRLQAMGFDEATIGRIRAPIGLPIGAISPAEIALSIMGEITAALRLGPDARVGEAKAGEARAPGRAPAA
jgi:xanthine dehydrogenase accessory factor